MYLHKEDYKVMAIDFSIAKEPIIKYHYLHRTPPASQCFGLYTGGELVGVVMYGSPPSKNLKQGIAGIDEALNVTELQRLWIAEGQPTNAASFLVGRTLKKVDKEIIVSYADTSQGHIGAIYQAANFLYTGLSAKRTDRTIKGRSGHSYELGWLTSQELQAKYGEDYSLVERPRKHRYLYINASGRRKQEILSKLLYPIVPYPKKTLDTIV